MPPRSIFASLELLFPSCCCSFPFPRVHLAKSLANSLRFLLSSCFVFFILILFFCFLFVFSFCSSCSCLFLFLSDSIPPRSFFAFLDLLLPSCCCSFPFPLVHLSKSLANSRRFLLTSCLACSKLIACCS